MLRFRWEKRTEERKLWHVRAAKNRKTERVMGLMVTSLEDRS